MLQKQYHVKTKESTVKNKDMDINYDYRKNIKKIENDAIEKINEIEKDYIMKSSIFFDSARKVVDEVFPKHNRFY